MSTKKTIVLSVGHVAYIYCTKCTISENLIEQPVRKPIALKKLMEQRLAGRESRTLSGEVKERKKKKLNVRQYGIV